MAKITIEEALCITGYLLEAHPSTGWFAHDAKGNEVPACAPEARCWCLLGALQLISYHFDVPFYDLLMSAERMLCLKPKIAETWDKALPARRASMIGQLKEAGHAVRA